MSYFRTCPCCGAHLDPGEVCDCKRNAALSVTSTQSGKAEQIVHLIPPPVYQNDRRISS